MKIEKCNVFNHTLKKETTKARPLKCSNNNNSNQPADFSPDPKIGELIP